MSSTINRFLATFGLILGFVVPIAVFAQQSANPQSYVDEPIKQLMKGIPELKTLQPATDQHELPMILARVGDKVDECFRNFVAVAAKEKITEKRLDRAGTENTLAQYQYDYVIERDTTKTPAMVEEYRVDDKGDVLPSYQPFVHYFFTGSFAASMLYLSKEWQPESTYRYVGEQMMGANRTYVLAFAQVPGASHSFKLSVNGVATATTRLQGIVWVDENNFQISQVRTDLLGSSDDRLSTVVVFRDVEPAGVARTMRLPISAHVYADLVDLRLSSYQNDHQFADYRRFGGSEPDQDTDAEKREQQNEQAHPYLEKPLSELTQHIPELTGIHPAVDQEQLPMILQKAGSTVDQFFANLVDVIASEEITQEKQTPGLPLAREHIRDSYLILRSNEGGVARFREFRMDAHGNRTAEGASNQGFVVTSGFALSVVHFSTVRQWDSRFLYLGDEKVDGRDTYVVAFAQLPSEAQNTVTMKGKNGVTVNILTQGVAWIDTSNFHIIQMRTDLLLPHPEVELDELTTEIGFSDVRFADVAVRLWLPRTVEVHVKATATRFGYPLINGGDDIFRNVYHYTNYRRYRVATQMITPK
jgi:hypothetical protein